MPSVLATFILASVGNILMTGVSFFNEHYIKNFLLHRICFFYEVLISAASVCILVISIIILIGISSVTMLDTMQLGLVLSHLAPRSMQIGMESLFQTSESLLLGLVLLH